MEGLFGNPKATYETPERIPGLTNLGQTLVQRYLDILNNKLSPNPYRGFASIKDPRLFSPSNYAPIGTSSTKTKGTVTAGATKPEGATSLSDIILDLQGVGDRKGINAYEGLSPQQPPGSRDPKDTGSVVNDIFAEIERQLVG